MKIIRIILFVLLLIGCNKTSNILIVTAKSNSVDCHMCPGYLLIKRGNTIDTVKMGSWGKPPSFNQFKVNKLAYKPFLVLFLITVKVKSIKMKK